MRQIWLTASTLKAILCYIDPESTPKIAYDNDEYIKPLIRKVTLALGVRDGSQLVIITFDNDEEELERQFIGVCHNISEVFTSLCENRLFQL